MKNTNTKNKGKISIFYILTFTFLILLSLMSFVILYVCKTGSFEALDVLSSKIMKRAVSISKRQTFNTLDQAVKITSLMGVLAPKDASMPDRQEDVSNILINALRNYPDVYTVYYGNENGEFFLVGKRHHINKQIGLAYFVKKISGEGQNRKVTETWYSLDGLLISSTILNLDEYDPRKRPWYIKGKEKGNAQWSDPYIFFITKLPGITYAVPIIEEGEFKGVIGSDLEIKALSGKLQNNSFTKNTVAFVVDSNNKVIGHSSYENLLEKHENKIPDVKSIRDYVLHNIFKNNPLNEKLLHINGQRYKYSYEKVHIDNLNLTVGLYTPEKDYQESMLMHLKHLYLFTFITIFVSILISTFISNSFSRPFRKLIKATKKVKVLDFDKHIDIKSGIIEVKEAENNFNQMLDSLLNYKNANDLFAENLKDAHLDTLYRLALAAEYKDSYTSEHLYRVSTICVMLAELLHFSQKEINLLKHASALHDVGKIGIPDTILMKKGKLTPDEYDIIKRHSDIGAKILQNPSSEIMEMAQVVAFCHHEKWDGTGYPKGLKGEDTPLEARIVSLADVLDALLSERSYKEAYSFDKTLRIITEEREKHFDPKLVDLFVENIDEFKSKILKDIKN